MEGNTKEIFADTIKTLIKAKPLDKITVKDITQTCGLSRQTFYRHFLDKYDLVNWYFERLVMASFEEMGISKTLKEALILKFTFIQKEHYFFKEAFKSNDYNSLKSFDFSCIYDFYQSILTKHGTRLNAEQTFLLKMYCRGSVDMTIEWILEDMPLPIGEITNLLIQATPQPIEVLFQFHNFM